MVLLVGIVGFIGSGKNSVSSTFVRNGFKPESFARPLKDACASIFSWPRDLLDGVTPSSRKWRETPDAFWSTHLGREITPRGAMQWLGTDVVRETLHEDVWLLSLLKRTEDELSVVITDVRFSNEIRAIKERGGVIVRVKRGTDPAWFKKAAAASRGSTAAARFMRDVAKVHLSEWDWVGSEADYTIENDGTLEDLREAVELVVNEIKSKSMKTKRSVKK